MRSLLVLLLSIGCSDPPRPEPREPRAEPTPRIETPEPPEPELRFPAVIRLDVDDERAIDQAVETAIRNGDLPGAVVRVGRRDGVVFERAYGMASLEPERRAMAPDMLFDLASVTKVITTIAVLQLSDAATVHLDRPVDRILPELAGWGITPRHLLLHTAGFRPVNPLEDYDDDRAASLSRALRNAPEQRPGTYAYSDLSFIALGVLVERVTGQSLDEVYAEQIFRRVGAEHAQFNPGTSDRVVPTEYAARRGDPPPMIHGVANDPRAWRLGGIAGHAGLFASADDLARVAEGLLGGELLRPQTLQLMHTATEVRRSNGQTVRRGLGVGMDDRRLEGWSASSFGHGGYTGTWLWVDPERDLYVVLLAHRVHPNGGGRSGPIRSTLGRLVNAAQIAPKRDAVRLGIDMLRARDFEALEGKRVAVLTNGAARARDGAPTWELLRRHADLKRIFTPEHGLNADREGTVESSSQDELEIVSLFGPNRTPQPEALADVDVVVVDLQDVGARFYTYGATMGRMMQAAADANVEVWVLDRPNPLGGQRIEGPILQESQRSFVNHQPGWPVQHGMTMGEMARLLKSERELDVELRVIEMEGWSRPMRWEDTGLRWVPPSPNLRTPTQVLLYPGIALVEGTNVSVGRGTDRPFELVGAPWMNAEAVLAAIPEEARVGLTVETTRFRPNAARHRGRWCRGLQITLADPATAHPIRFGLALLKALSQQEGWEPERAVRIVGDERITTALDRPLAELESIGSDQRTDFERRRNEALIYRDP